MKYNELSKRLPQHILVYGDPKTGKSTLASQLAHTRKLIWISLDGGHSVIDKLPEDVRENIDIIVIPDVKAAPIAQQTVRELFKGNKTTICHMHGMVNCSVCKSNNLDASTYHLNNLGLDTVVVVDHGTRLSESYINNITKNKPDDYKLQLDDWGDLRFHLAAHFGYVQVAPFNVVYLAQTAYESMNDGSKKICPDIGSSKFGPTVSQYFDNVVYMEIMNMSHRAGSGTTYKASVITGSRSDIHLEDLYKTNGGKLSLEPFFANAPLASDAEEGKRILIDSKLAMNSSTATVAATAKEIAKAGGEAPVIATDRVAAILAAAREKAKQKEGGK